ncbi:MAG: trehalase family glycosidase [Bacteroidota bacterium]
MIAVDQLIDRAKQVLLDNKGANAFTIPTRRLYPFQWNWDSGFTALGYMHFDQAAAKEEIRSLLSGQWENGMVPHIIFHSENETDYFPNWDFWNAHVNPGAPSKPKTSGITQPPVLGFILDEWQQRFPDHPEVLSFANEVFDQIVDFHRFWYTYRDPLREGLVFIFHPWESGRDNSPLWDEALNLIDLKRANLPNYQRRDITIADHSERPTSTQYDQYVYLLLLGQKHQYDGQGIFEESEFLIQDTLINALLIRSNEGLIRIGKLLNKDVGELEEWQQQSVNAYNQKLWNSQLNHYVDYDLRQEKQMQDWEIGGLTALYAGIPDQERAGLMTQYLQELKEKNYLLTPSFDVFSEQYDSKRYWRGPIWPQMNWLIFKGLHRYGFSDLAHQNRADFLELVQRFGFYEYFEAQRHLVETSHGGYGGNHFSWTASSVIDLIKHP